MPWAFYMATWLHDPHLSYLRGKPSFRRPYPKDDWLEDARWNRFPIDAMEYTIEAVRIMSKKPETWTDGESAWYEDYQADLMKFRSLWQTDDTT